MAKKRLIENLVEKTKKLKEKISKRVLPLVLAGGIAVGSIFGLAGCDTKNNEVIKNDGIENSEIVELRDLVESLQDEVNDLKTAVDTKADLKTVSEISKELTSIAKTLAELTKNIANINDYYLSLSKKVEDMQQEMDKLAEMYNKQDEALTMLINKLDTLEAKVQTLSNSNSNTNNTSDNTSNNELQAQIGEMKQVVNRLALENAIQKTANARYSKLSTKLGEDKEVYYDFYTSPNGDFCARVEEDGVYSYICAEDNFVCGTTTDGKNIVNCGDVYNTIQQLYVLCQGGYLSMSFDDCNVTRDKNRFIISRTRDGKIETSYVTLEANGFVSYISFNDTYVDICSVSKYLFDMAFNESKVAQKAYNDLKQIINNSWADDCLVYSPIAEEGEEYVVYFDNNEGYMYMNEEEYGKTYGVAEDGYTASITQTPNGELELYENNTQNLMQSFKDVILNNGENMLISYNAKNNSYVIEDEDTIKIEYIVEDNEIVSIKVTDKENNITKECVSIISQAEFTQKADEIQAKFDELKAQYEASQTQTLGQ